MKNVQNNILHNYGHAHFCALFTSCHVKVKIIWCFPRTSIPLKYEGHPGSKEHLRIQSVHLFCCSLSLVSGVQCDFENCLMQLYVGSCHVVSAEIAVAMDMPTDNLADCEVRGVIRFLQANEILVRHAEEARSCVELFYCTTMHVRILPARHKSFCVSILRIVLNWHRRTFFCFQKWSTMLVKLRNDEDLSDAGWITRRPHGMNRVYTNLCQSTTRALMSEATMWKSRRSYVPKHLYSVSVLLILL